VERYILSRNKAWLARETGAVSRLYRFMRTNRPCFPVAGVARVFGVIHGRKLVECMMREAGPLGACHRPGGPTTRRRDKDARAAPDLVDRTFPALGPDRLWVADVTYVPTAAGFLYLAVVLDAWSRKIVGWSIANHLGAELVLDALEVAVGQR